MLPGSTADVARVVYAMQVKVDSEAGRKDFVIAGQTSGNVTAYYGQDEE